jgi:hypothetical protein
MFHARDVLLRWQIKRQPAATQTPDLHGERPRRRRSVRLSNLENVGA